MQAIGADVRILRGQSFERIPELRAANESFDLIYVDGSHERLDVITDAALSWPRARRPQCPAGRDDQIRQHMHQAKGSGWSKASYRSHMNELELERHEFG